MKDFELGIRITADGKVAVVEAGKVTTSLKQIAGGAKEAEQSASAVSTALSKVGHYGVAYLGVTQVINFAGALSQAALAADRLNNTLKFSTGSAQAGAAALEYVREVSNRLGVDLGAAGAAFAKFAAAAQGTNLGMRDIKAVFEGVSKASVVLGLSTEKSNAAMLALSQMMSKGTVQAEELRGQLGEHIPGAFNIAARAMGVTTAELGKMLEQGQVISEDFLPKFAAEMERTFGAAAGEAANSAIANVNRLNSAWEQFKRDFGQASNAAGRPKWLIDGLIEASATMREATKSGHALLGVMASLTGFFAGASGGGKFSDDAVKRRAIDIQEELARLKSKPKNSLAFDTEKRDLERVKELQQELQGIFAQGKLKLPSIAELKAEADAQLERTRKDLETANKFSASWSQAYQNEAAKKKDAITKLDALYVQETARFRGNQEMQLKLATDYATKRAQIDKQFEDKGVAKTYAGAQAKLDSQIQLIEDEGKRSLKLLEQNHALELLSDEEFFRKKIALRKKEIDQELELLGRQLANANRRGEKADAARIAGKMTRLGAEQADLGNELNFDKLKRDKEARDEAIKIVDQATLASQEYQAQLQFETALIGKTALQTQILTEQRRIDLAVQKQALEIINNPKFHGRESEAEKAIEALDAQANAAKKAAETELTAREAVNRSWSTGATRAIDSYIDDVGNAAKQSEKLFAKAFKGMEDAIVQFVKTGKLNFSDLARSIIDDLIRIQIQEAITLPWANAIKAGGLFGGTAGFFGSLFANGGIMSSSGPLPLRAYASGGIASSPQLALFGEGSMNEAYVPLPDGRRIPVKLEGQAAGAPGNTYNVSVAVDASGSSVQGDAATATELGRRIEGAVRRVLVNEKRPGGLLA